MMVEFNSMGARCKMDAVYCWGCLSLGIHPCLEWTVGWFVLYRNTVRYQTSILSHLSVILTVPLGESPFVGNEDLLPSWELELGSPQSLDHLLLVLVSGTYRQENLSDVDAGDGSLGLTEGTTHTSLEPISS